VLNKLGKDASGLYSEADKWMKAKADEYTKNMKNPRMIQNFQRRAEGTILSQSESNSRYETAQLRAYRIGEADMAIETAINNAAANWDNEAAVAAARQSADRAMELKYRGAGDDVRKWAMAELDSKIAMARLGRMIEADPMKAKTWYEENKKHFTGLQQGRAEEILEKETNAYKIEGIRDDLIKRHGMNYTSARKEILDNYQGHEEQQVLSLYEGWHSDQKRIRDEAEKAAQDNYFKRLQSFSTKEAALDHALKNSKTLYEFNRAKGFITWMFDEQKVTPPGMLDKTLSEIEDGKFDGMSLEQFKFEVAKSFSKDDFKEYVQPSFRERRSDVKTTNTIANSAIASQLRKEKERLGSDVVTIERIERRYRQALKENPTMPAEDRLELYKKLRTKEKLESTWNPFSGAFWNPRKERGIDVMEMAERGYQYNPRTRRYENNKGEYIED
jgi:hypothetical protein